MGSNVSKYCGRLQAPKSEPQQGKNNHRRESNSEYPGELTTRTADLRTTKIMLNSVIRTRGARYMTADAVKFYLATPMKRNEYLGIAAELILQEFMDLYDLYDKVKNGYVYSEIVRGMYGLPQAGILANKLLKV